MVKSPDIMCWYQTVLRCLVDANRALKDELSTLKEQIFTLKEDSTALHEILHHLGILDHELPAYIQQGNLSRTIEELKTELASGSSTRSTKETTATRLTLVNLQNYLSTVEEVDGQYSASKLKSQLLQEIQSTTIGRLEQDKGHLLTAWNLAQVELQESNNQVVYLTTRLNEQQSQQQSQQQGQPSPVLVDDGCKQENETLVRENQRLVSELQKCGEDFQQFKSTSASDREVLLENENSIMFQKLIVLGVADPTRPPRTIRLIVQELNSTAAKNKELLETLAKLQKSIKPGKKTVVPPSMESLKVTFPTWGYERVSIAVTALKSLEGVASTIRKKLAYEQNVRKFEEVSGATLDKDNPLVLDIHTNSANLDMVKEEWKNNVEIFVLQNPVEIEALKEIDRVKKQVAGVEHNLQDLQEEKRRTPEYNKFQNNRLHTIRNWLMVVGEQVVNDIFHDLQQQIAFRPLSVHELQQIYTYYHEKDVMNMLRDRYIESKKDDKRSITLITEEFEKVKDDAFLEHMVSKPFDIKSPEVDKGGVTFAQCYVLFMFCNDRNWSSNQFQYWVSTLTEQDKCQQFYHSREHRTWVTFAITTSKSVSLEFVRNNANMIEKVESMNPYLFAGMYYNLQLRRLKLSSTPLIQLITDEVLANVAARLMDTASYLRPCGPGQYSVLTLPNEPNWLE